MTRPKAMTQKDKAQSFDLLRNIANDKGYATIGEALHETPRKDELK